ncbi:MAG: EAL domain-containing protein, partial [Lachnospiraceae bacterium]|nr:EAL domain-containing protein [Lachnospiraceae bacterium]
EIACDRAYIALQAIKDSYVYRINYFTREMRDNLLVEQEIVKDSEEALKNREFFVMYQPIVDAKTREIVAAEALVRWRKPEGGFVSPGDFIPTFEKNGFVSKVDRYVWEEVCKLQAERKAAGKRTVPVSVNLSRMDFYNSELYEELSEVAKQYGLDGKHIKVEVTESAYMDQTLELMSTMNKFRNSGYQVLMDDFGSGFSSLNMLKDFEVDVLKIDMKFMDSIDTSERAGNILYSIIQMAKTIKMQIVAEGVETVNQFEMLKNMDCDCIQGYYFYKPLPAEEFEQRLDADEKEMSADSLAASSRLLYFGQDEQEADEIVRLLERGSEITVVKTPEEAFEHLEKHFGNVSLILVDFDAVGADGDRFLSGVSGRKFYGKIPIMLLAKSETVDSISHYIWEGVLDIVTKPYNTAVLKNRMEHAIEYFAAEAERTEIRMMGKGVLLRQQMNSFFENSIAGIARVAVDLTEEMNILELSYVNDRFLSLHVLTLDEATQKKTLSGLLSRIVYNGLYGVDKNVYTVIQKKEPFLLREYSIEQRDGNLCNVVAAFSFKYLSDMVQIDMVLLENTSSLEQRVIDMVGALSRYYQKDGAFEIWRYYIDRDVIDHYMKQADGKYKRVLEYNASRNVLSLAKADDTSQALKSVAEIYKALQDGAESLERDILVNYEDNGKIKDRWDRVTYFRKKDFRGDYAIGIMRDVTEEYKIHHLSWAHDRFMQLMSDADVYVEADLTDNRIINGEEIKGILTPYGITERTPYDEMLRLFSNNIDENDRDKMLGLLTRKELLRQFRLGNTILTVDFMGQTLRRPLWSWYEAMVLLGENPKTKHVEIGLKLTCIEQSRRDSERRIFEYDSLTGLYNRVMFEKTIDRQLDDRIRSGIEEESAFLLIDLDGFKRVNDVFGHDVGDSILKTIAKLITDELGEDAVTGRISGDEFVAFLPAAGNRKEVCEKLKQINEKTNYELDATLKAGEIIKITTSIGVVFTNDPKDRFQKLYPKADLAMYQAKEAGRNTFRIYENPL